MQRERERDVSASTPSSVMMALTPKRLFLSLCISISLLRPYTFFSSSSWLNALPLVEHGFDLSKSAFCDAVSLRYGWEIKSLPSTCACGAHFNPAHTLQCPTSGYTITRHNEVRDLLAESLREVSTNVSVARAHATATHWRAPPAS